MKHFKYLIILISISLLITLCVSYSFKDNLKSFTSEGYSFTYDKSWKLTKKDNTIKLIHKKTKSTLNIQCKTILDNYIDTSLSSIISDIVNSIEEQNPDYRLINKKNTSDKLESYSYLYESEKEQVLVNIYKENNKIVIVYFISPTEYFDIILDSVDTILDSLEIMSGERISDF